MCSNPCEFEVTCFRPESNRGPYGLLKLCHNICRQVMPGLSVLDQLQAEACPVLSLISRQLKPRLWIPTQFPSRSKTIETVICCSHAWTRMAKALSAGDIVTDAEVCRAAIEAESLGYSCKTTVVPRRGASSKCYHRTSNGADSTRSTNDPSIVKARALLKVCLNSCTLP